MITTLKLKVQIIYYKTKCQIQKIKIFLTGYKMSIVNLKINLEAGFNFPCE